LFKTATFYSNAVRFKAAVRVIAFIMIFCFKAKKNRGLWGAHGLIFFFIQIDSACFEPVGTLLSYGDSPPAPKVNFFEFNSHNENFQPI